jgi:hypothetical protein
MPLRSEPLQGIGSIPHPAMAYLIDSGAILPSHATESKPSRERRCFTLHDSKSYLPLNSITSDIAVNGCNENGFWLERQKEGLDSNTLDFVEIRYVLLDGLKNCPERTCQLFFVVMIHTNNVIGKMS